jgi:hypothetical protein
VIHVACFPASDVPRIFDIAVIAVSLSVDLLPVALFPVFE